MRSGVPEKRSRRSRSLICCCLALLGLAAAQTPPPPQNEEEVTSRQEAVTFRERVNLVMVPVVVRDRQGRSVGNLQREDFRLLDQGKPQTISKFTVERRGEKQARTQEPEETIEKAVGEAPAAVPPERYIAYLFDDVHLDFADLARARDAAASHLAALRPEDRAAIFSTSGQNPLDFTDDRDKLRQALLGLRPRSIARSQIQACPDLSYYMADLVVNKREPEATNAAIQETIVCLHLDPKDPSSLSVAGNTVQSEGRRVLETEGHEARLALLTLRDAVRRISAMPGQRIIVLVSPGFLTGEYRIDEIDVIDRAIRGSVTVNTLDARGLTAGSIADASRPGVATLRFSALKTRYDSEAEQAQANILAELADGTGGRFFHWSNDLESGFNRLAGAPEHTYILGFSPQNLKVDGRYHALKVSVREQRGLSITARRGYFAPKQSEDEAETAQREIEEALFSREEMQEIPAEVHTQFFKTGEENARLTVLARVDVRQLRYRKLNGRNLNNLTVVAGLFDRNGNYIKGNRVLVDMRLLDQTLETRLRGPITLKSLFDVTPGGYFIRMVVRDAEGRTMSARNGSVEIP